MGIFGWSLPPGCTHRMIDEQCEDHPCEDCGLFPEDCVCPICPRCGQQGDPDCYKEPDLGICGELYRKETPRQRLEKARFDRGCLKDEMQSMEQRIAYLEQEELASRFSWMCWKCGSLFTDPGYADMCCWPGMEPEA